MTFVKWGGIAPTQTVLDTIVHTVVYAVIVCQAGEKPNYSFRWESVVDRKISMGKVKKQ